VLAALLLLALLVPVAAVVVARSGRPDVAPGPVSPALRTTARTTGRWRLAGLLLGVLAALVASQQGGLGRGPLLAAPLLALCVLAGVLVGELRVSAPRGTVRTAGLQVRRVSDYVPPGLGRAVVAAAVGLAVVLGLTSLAGSPDDLGRAGRSLVRQCSAVMTESHGPWPGSFYALPLGALVLCGLLAAGVALTRVVRRPRQTGDVAVDDALRRSAATSVTAAAGLLVSIPLAGVAAFAAAGLLGIDCRPGWWTVPIAALAVLAPAAVALAAWCAVTLAWPPPAVLEPRPLVRQR
jgi:hypothetical protein